MISFARSFGRIQVFNYTIIIIFLFHFFLFFIIINSTSSSFKPVFFFYYHRIIQFYHSRSPHSLTHSFIHSLTDDSCYHHTAFIRLYIYFSIYYHRLLEIWILLFFCNYTVLGGRERERFSNRSPFIHSSI